MSLPYLPLFVDDYEADTAHLTLVEDGIYCRLLRLCWRSAKCCLPNDPEFIARKIRVANAAEHDAMMRVISEFFTSRNGNIFNKRLSAEHKRVSAIVLKRKKAGRSGGLSKSMKSRDNPASKATDLLQHPYPEPEPYEKPSGFSKRAGAQKQKGFVEIRKTGDAVRTLIEEIRNDGGRIGGGDDIDRENVLLLPAVGGSRS